MVEIPPAVARELELAALKRQIREGTYETPEKIEAAIDAFLDEMSGDKFSSDERGEISRRPHRPK